MLTWKIPDNRRRSTPNTPTGSARFSSLERGRIVTYLLDTNIISYFLQAQHEDKLATAATCVSMAIVDEVRKELEEGYQR